MEKIIDMEAMTKNKTQHICPVERAGGLDNSLRRLVQNPRRILRPYINDGMKVLDLGCGPGFFTTEIARMMNGTGSVIAADLQEGMLDKLYEKILGTDLEKKIRLHKCEENNLGLNEKVDFILAFYVIHEVPDMDHLFGEFKSILKPGGKVFIVEPGFHVSANEFEEMIKRILSSGFRIIGRPKILLSRSVILTGDQYCLKHL